MLTLSRKSLVSVAAITASVALTGCGKNYGPLTFTAVNSSSSPTLLSSLNPFASSSPAIAAISEFKVCIKKVQLEDETGEAQTGEDSEEKEIEFKPGLINLTSLTTETTIGTLTNAPVDFKISKIKIRVRRDESLCGDGTHSISWKEDSGATHTSDDEIEFKWNFNPAVALSGGETVQLTFAEFTAALAGVSSGNDFNTRISGATGTARIKSR